MRKPSAILSFATCFVAVILLTQAPAGAAVIDSITSSEGPPASTTDTAGTLTSITVGGTTYSDLLAPTSLSSADNVDYVAIGTVPTTVDGALGSLDLDTGTLNYDFTVQFGQTVQDGELFFVLNNTTSPPQRPFDAFTIQAINSGGGSVGSATVFPDNFDTPEIVIPRTWNRTGGSTLTGRRMYGFAFTLDDLGLPGSTDVTGFTLTTSGLDSAVVGLAIPEPATIGLLAFGGLVLVRRQSR